MLVGDLLSVNNCIDSVLHEALGVGICWLAAVGGAVQGIGKKEFGGCGAPQGTIFSLKLGNAC